MYEKLLHITYTNLHFSKESLYNIHTFFYKYRRFKDLKVNLVY